MSLVADRNILFYITPLALFLNYDVHVENRELLPVAGVPHAWPGGPLGERIFNEVI
jgi:hypothetical protein